MDLMTIALWKRDDQFFRFYAVTRLLGGLGGSNGRGLRWLPAA